MFTYFDMAVFGLVFLPLVSLSTKATTLVFCVDIIMHKACYERLHRASDLGGYFVSNKEEKTYMGAVILNASNLCMSGSLTTIARELAKYFSRSTGKRCF